MAGERRWHPLPVRLEFGSAFTRHVFLRAPTKGAEGAAEGLALFVAAVPAGWNESHLRELMEIFGVVAEASLVVLDSAPDVAGGLVRFEDDKAIRRALAAATPGAEPVDPPSSLARPVGLDAWVGDHRAARPGPEALQTRIDEWFLEFEAEEERKARAAKGRRRPTTGGLWWRRSVDEGRRRTTRARPSAASARRQRTSAVSRGSSQRKTFIGSSSGNNGGANCTISSSNSRRTRSAWRSSRPVANSGRCEGVGGVGVREPRRDRETSRFLRYGRNSQRRQSSPSAADSSTRLDASALTPARRTAPPVPWQGSPAHRW